MTKIGFIATSLMVATAGLFVSCSADDDTLASEQSAYSYSASEIQEILELQEEYGVKFEMPTSTNGHLPSIESIENLCKAIVLMQSSSKHGIKKGNKIVFSPKRRRLAKIPSDAETYSGSDGGTHTENGWKISYEVTWENVSPTLPGGSVNCSIDASVKDWDFSVYDFDYHFEGSSTIVYTITVKADNLKDHSYIKFYIDGECNM